MTDPKHDTIDWHRAKEETVSTLRDLLRLDTSNPPGNELIAAEYLADRLRQEGLEPRIVESADRRGNVVARLKGSGSRPPLLLSAHLDVVPATPSQWTHPPFAGVVEGGYVYGRGAADMKYAAAQFLTVVSLLKRLEVPLVRDVIFAGVADEEQGCRLGSGFLVDHHRELIQAETALTEIGGLVMPMGQQTVLLVGTATKGFEWLRVRVKGEPGHGSKRNPGSAIHELAARIDALRHRRLSYRAVDAATAFVTGIGAAQGGAARLVMSLLKCPALAPLALRLIPGERRRVFEAALYNTAVVTTLHAGDESVANVVDEYATATIDARYLPTVARESFLDELRRALGDGVELESFRGLPPSIAPLRSPLLDLIAAVARERDPAMTLVPFLVQGFTDANQYSRAGIQTYGFAPVYLLPNEPFADLFHSPNERISIDGMGRGLELLYAVVERYCRR